MIPYRDGSGAGLVCTRCGELTPPNPHVPADAGRVSEETFVCVECLLRMQELASRGREPLWIETGMAPPPRAVSTKDALVIGGAAIGAFVALSLVVQGQLFFLLMLVAAGGLVYAIKNGDREALWITTVRRGSIALLAVALAGQLIIRFTPARTPRLDVPVDPVVHRGSLPDVPPPDPAASGRPELPRIDERLDGFVAFEEGLAAGEATLPKGFPAAWRFLKTIPVSPFNGGVWTTDDTLTDTHVLLERDRLRLGGKSTRQGAPVTCAGVVEPAGDEPAVFVASCRDESGTASYRVLRVTLPELTSLLASAPPSKWAIPAAQRGTFKGTSDDCRTKEKKVTITASTMVEEDGFSFVAITSTPTSLGTPFRATNVRGAGVCSGMLDRWNERPRLASRCLGWRSRTLCPGR